MQLSPEMQRQARNIVGTLGAIGLMWLHSPMATAQLSPGMLQFLGEAISLLFGAQMVKRLGDKSRSEHELEVVTVANNVAASLMPPRPSAVIVPPPLGAQQLRVTPYDVSDLAQPSGKERR